LYSSKILKSKYVSVTEPVPINTISSEDFYDYREDDEAEDSESEAIESDPEVKAQEIIADAKKEAEAILEASRFDAENLLQMKKEEADRYREEVVCGAHEEGYSKGFEEGKAAFDKSLKDIQTESQKLNESYKQLIGSAEPQIIKLVLEIAQKVIDEDVKINKENMVRIVKNALEMCYEKQSAVIKISASDYEYLNQNVPDLLTQINSYENISIKQDANLKDNDCVVDTSFGTVDMGIDKRFAKIEDAFIQEVS
jgi:Flagellar biosynthesis/type III secretory pathway protein